MSSAKKKADLDRDTLLAYYMNDTLEEGAFPTSEYRFCKNHKIKEAEFYTLFPSLDALKKAVWSAFLEKTLGLLDEDNQYQSYANREKMLTFFYAFFELLTLNRSYVLFSLKEEDLSLKNMRQLSGLRKGFLEYAAALVEASNDEKSSRITKQSPRLYSEGAWLQMLFLIRFWMRDDSAGFEKTDLAIEKSVNTIFDIFDNTPLESALDFGKFLFKEGIRK